MNELETTEKEINKEPDILKIPEKIEVKLDSNNDVKPEVKVEDKFVSAVVELVTESVETISIEEEKVSEEIIPENDLIKKLIKSKKKIKAVNC